MRLSPQAGSHTASPQTQLGAQSAGQLALVSPQLGRHCPSPQAHEKQSLGQVEVFSPQFVSQS